MSSIDRRRFLQVAGATAAAASTARGAEKKIRVGILGTQHGHLRSKLRALRASPDFEIVSAHENDEALQKRIRGEERFAGLKWVSEDDLLTDDSLDVIVVECKVWQAIPWGHKVLDAGRHLHLEKPPSPDLESFKKLVEKAKAKRRILQLGYN